MNPLFTVADAGGDFYRGMGALAEAHQRLGEVLVGVHGDVAGHVVEDIGLGKIVQAVASPDGNGCGEFAVAQAVEE